MKIDPITGELLDEDNEGQDGQDTPTSEPDTTAPTLAAVSLAVVSAIDKDALIAKVAERQLTKRLAVVVDEVLDSLDFSTYTESIKETALAQLSTEGIPAAAPAVVAPPAPPVAPAAVQETAADEPENMYEDIYTFFSAELHPFYVRESPFLQEKDTEKRALAWCPQWWLHIEAVTRVSALWHGWEKSRLESGAALSTWILDHADRHMERLLNPQGPFRYCSCTDGHARKATPFIVEEYPDSLAISDAPRYNADGELKAPAPETGQQ